MVGENPEPQNIDGLSASPSSGTEGVPQKEVSPGGIFKEPTSDKPEKKPKKKLIILAVVLGLLVIGGGVGLGGWYYLGQQKKMKEAETKPPEVVKPPEEKPAEAETLPAGFKKITINAVECYYPEAWGVPKAEETKENIVTDGLGTTYAGGNAVFGEYDSYMQVNNMASYINGSSAASWGSMVGETVEYLKKVYKEQKIEPEELYGAGQSGLLPTVNAAVMAYNPRYVESTDQTWRGYWYLAEVTQGSTAEIKFVAVLYNQKIDKVYSVTSKIANDWSDQMQNELMTIDSNKITEWTFKKREYMKTAYFENKQVKEAVDGKLLVMVKNLK